MQGRPSRPWKGNRLKKIGSRHDGHDAYHSRRTSSSTSNPGENVEPALAPDNVASPLHKPEQEVPLQQHKQTAGSPERLLEMVRWSDGPVTEDPASERPGPRIVPSCHPGWGAVSDLGGSFAERGFKIGHRRCGTTTRAIKTAPFN